MSSNIIIIMHSGIGEEDSEGLVLGGVAAAGISFTVGSTDDMDFLGT
jgi:hypothetical protein